MDGEGDIQCLGEEVSDAAIRITQLALGRM